MSADNWLRNIFLGRVYSADYEDIEDGGPICASQMFNSFRLTIIALSVVPT